MNSDKIASLITFSFICFFILGGAYLLSQLDERTIEKKHDFCKSEGYIGYDRSVDNGVCFKIENNIWVQRKIKNYENEYYLYKEVRE